MGLLKAQFKAPIDRAKGKRMGLLLDESRCQHPILKIGSVKEYFEMMRSAYFSSRILLLSLSFIALIKYSQGIISGLYGTLSNNRSYSSVAYSLQTLAL